MAPKPIKPIILMADDDSDDRMLVQDALRESGLHADLRFVEDGEELLDYLLGRGKYEPANMRPIPRLILLDLNMPRKSGREALTEIKSERHLRMIPVVILTTSQAETDVHQSYSCGVNSYITKPVTYEGLVALMRTLSLYWFETVQLPPQSARE